MQGKNDVWGIATPLRPWKWTLSLSLPDRKSLVDKGMSKNTLDLASI